MALSYLKLFYSFRGDIEILTMEERGRLLTAMLEYAETGKVPEETLCGNERFLFPVCRQRIDRDAETYDRMVEVNTANGKKGGRPRKNPPVFSETEKSQEEEKEEEQEKEKENEKEQEKGEGEGSLCQRAPTLRQVMDYCRQEKLSVDGLKFHSYYTANGWRSGGVSIVDWRAKLRQWDREDRRAAPRHALSDALNYQQRTYAPQDFGDDFYLDLDKYATRPPGPRAELAQPGSGGG